MTHGAGWLALRVLLVSPFLPYPDASHAGAKLVHCLLETLAERHHVHLVTRCFEGEGPQVAAAAKGARDITVVRARGPVRPGHPLSILESVASYARLARAAAQVQRREPFDLCQVEFTEAGVFFRPRPAVPALLTCHDVMAKPAYRRWVSASGPGRPVRWASWRFVRAVEGRTVRKFQRVFVLSDEDREWGERLYPAARFRVLRYPGGLGFAGLARREVPGRVLFVGAMNRPQNVEGVRWFLRGAWPTVRGAVPDAQFWVVGGGIAPAVRQEFESHPGVTVTGFVPNIEEHYAAAAVFVAPILVGGGVIVKILDAMAAGVAVVTTGFGNEGIRAREGVEALVSDDPATFGGAVASLLRAPVRRQALATAGRSLILERFSHEALKSALDATYGEIVSPAAPDSAA